MTLFEQLDLPMPKAVLTQHFQRVGASENVYVPGRVNKEVGTSVLGCIFPLTALISQIRMHGLTAEEPALQ